MSEVLARFFGSDVVNFSTTSTTQPGVCISSRWGRLTPLNVINPTHEQHGLKVEHIRAHGSDDLIRSEFGPRNQTHDCAKLYREESTVIQSISMVGQALARKPALVQTQSRRQTILCVDDEEMALSVRKMVLEVRRSHADDCEGAIRDRQRKFDE